jgi:hypothetical protein
VERMAYLYLYAVCLQEDILGWCLVGLVRGAGPSLAGLCATESLGMEVLISRTKIHYVVREVSNC